MPKRFRNLNALDVIKKCLWIFFNFGTPHSGAGPPEFWDFTVTIACLLGVWKKFTQWHSVKLQQGKHWGFVTLWALSGQCTGWGGEPEHTWTVLVRDLYHHAEDCLAVWLPSSCNAALLIAKATTQLKELAFCQSIRRYQILCCYRVSRQGLLNVQWLRELVRVDKEMLVSVSILAAICFYTLDILHWEA